MINLEILDKNYVPQVKGSKIKNKYRNKKGGMYSSQGMSIEKRFKNKKPKNNFTAVYKCIEK